MRHPLPTHRPLPPPPAEEDALRLPPPPQHQHQHQQQRLHGGTITNEPPCRPSRRTRPLILSPVNECGGVGVKAPHTHPRVPRRRV